MEHYGTMALGALWRDACAYAYAHHSMRPAQARAQWGTAMEAGIALTPAQGRGTADRGTDRDARRAGQRAPQRASDAFMCGVRVRGIRWCGV